MDKNKSPKFNTKKIIYASITIFIILTIIGTCIFVNTPSKRLQRCLDNNNYTKAVSIYNNNFDETLEDTFNSRFLEHISGIVSLWMSGELNSNDAILQLEEIEKIHNTKISKEASEQKNFVILEDKNGKLHKQAEECYLQEDYINAMSILTAIDPEYSQINAANTLYTTCKSIILNNVSNLTSIDEYENAIKLLDECLSLVNEPDFLKTKNELEEELLVLKDVIYIIENAEKLYNSGKYKQAFTTISDGLKKYPDRAELIESDTILHEMYIILISQQVKTACEEEDYNSALSIIDVAIKEYDCIDFQQLKESVKEQKSWIYRNYKNIKEKLSALTSSWKSEKIDVKQTGADIGSYILNSGEKILLGDFSEKDITVLSLTSNLIASIANLDLIFDIRDFAYDIQHIKEEDYFVARIATDVIALLPVIGVVKYLKYTDKFKDGTKILSDLAELVTNSSKTAEKVADAVKATKPADNIAEAVDNATDIAKKAERWGEAANSKILRNNMLAAGKSEPNFNNAAHHIVAGDDPRAEAARNVLKKFNIDINNSTNGVFLPIQEGLSKAAYHPKLHKNDYYQKVNERLLEATNKDEVLEVLNDIAKSLLDGSF